MVCAVEERLKQQAQETLRDAVASLAESEVGALRAQQQQMHELLLRLIAEREDERAQSKELISVLQRQLEAATAAQETEKQRCADLTAQHRSDTAGLRAELECWEKEVVAAMDSVAQAAARVSAAE